MKKVFFMLLALIVVTVSLPSCGDAAEDNGAITIVTTVFPEYDWVTNILGQAHEDVKVILLTENGTDLHSFQPTVSDIAKISACDIFICTGGVSDAWVEDALSSAPNANRTIIKLMSLLSEEQKLVEQSQHHNTTHDEHEHHEDEYDEHVWLSLKNAKLFCRAIAEALCEKLPERAEIYEKNCESYVAALDELDVAFAQAVNEAETQTLLFADRFPFSYLTHDYGITCYAAFPGCSAETEASFETVAFLAERIDSLALPAVVVLENTDLALAQTVIATTKEKNADIVTMDSLQSVSREDIRNGATYLDIMRNNLNALCSALGK